MKILYSLSLFEALPVQEILPIEVLMYSYIFPVIGPVIIAGAQFLITLQLLHSLDPAKFGSFSFLMIAAQLTIGIWGALFCAPLPSIFKDGDKGRQEKILSSIFTANLVSALTVGFIFYGISTALQLNDNQAIPFAVFAVINLLRSYARAYAYVNGRNRRTTISDLTYGACLLLGLAVLTFWQVEKLSAVCFLMALGSIIGIASFGKDYLARQFLRVSVSSLKEYAEIWRSYARWSVIGVITTEATANAQAYIVTLSFGPQSFAPVAASALFIRPIAVIMNALTDFERPRLARLIAGGDTVKTKKLMHLFSYALWFTWAGSVSAAAFILYYMPHVAFPEAYAMNEIVFGVVCWLAIAALRIIRTPESTVLQAGGKFKLLAGSSIYSCGFSIVAVAVLVSFGTPMWSMIGVLAGEFVFAVSIRARAKQFLSALDRAVTA
jgi:hypothetical protein